MPVLQRTSYYVQQAALASVRNDTNQLNTACQSGGALVEPNVGGDGELVRCSSALDRARLCLVLASHAWHPSKTYCGTLGTSDASLTGARTVSQSFTEQTPLITSDAAASLCTLYTYAQLAQLCAKSSSPLWLRVATGGAGSTLSSDKPILFYATQRVAADLAGEDLAIESDAPEYSRVALLRALEVIPMLWQQFPYAPLRVV